MRVVLLAGGTGGAKLAVGLQAALAPGDLAVIANVGDDCEFWGLHVSPDVDAVLFRLAGIFNEVTGFGIENDTFATQETMRRLGMPGWFALGDRDLAFHVARTAMLRRGARLTETSLDLGRRLGLHNSVLPVTDDPVRTWFETAEGDLAFQDYYVRRRAEAEVRGVTYAGLGAARPSPEVRRALAAADLVVIGPSNPVVSVWPILEVVRPLVRAEITVAVSPTVGGRALKGPTVEMMRALGRDPSPAGIAAEYRGLASRFVLDHEDDPARGPIEALGYEVMVTDTVMRGAEATRRLAEELLAGH